MFGLRDETRRRMADGASQAGEPLISKIISGKTFALSIAMTLLVCLAVLSWFKIPLEVMPRANVPPYLYVYVNSSQNMAPERMELFLTLPVEGALRTVGGLIGLSGQTNSRGASFSLTLRPRTNLDLATIQIQEALQELEAAGVLDMRQVNISRLNPEASAVAKVGITFGAKVKSPFHRIQEELREALESVPEISKVDIMGLEPTLYEFTIPISQAQDMGVRPDVMSAALNFSPLRESLGTLLRQNQTLPVQARMVVDDLETVKRVNLGKTSMIPLSGIGQERRIDKATVEVSHNNGRAVVFLEVFAKDSANLFAMTDHLKAAMAKFNDLDFEVVFNKTDDLQSALHEVMTSLYQAIIITFAVVFFFLRNGRKTTLICVTIPITLLATVLVLYVSGDTLNVLTLSGLILGIGMVVDNAVLVTGMIDELKTKYGIKQAAGRGAARVLMALLMSTVTNAIIFLPVSFIEGGDSFTDILKAFQLPIVASLVVSLVIALFLLPLLIIMWPGHKSAQPAAHSLQAPELALRFFRWTARHRAPIAMAALLLVGVIAESALNIEQSDIGTPREAFTQINVQFPPEMPSEDRRATFADLEKKVLALRPSIGYRFVVSEFNPEFTSGSLMVYPNSSDDIDPVLDKQEVALKKFLASLPKQAGVSARIGWDSVGAGATSAVKVVDTFSIAGSRSLTIEELLKAQKAQVGAIYGVESARLEKEENGETQLVFLADDAIVSQYGLTLQKIASGIQSSMTSVSVSGLRFNGQAVAAKISLGPSAGTAEWTLNALRNLRLSVNDQTMVTLNQLGSFQPVKSLNSISRKDGSATGKLYVSYKQSLSVHDLQRARAAVHNVIDNFEYPKGYGPPKSDSQERILEMQAKSNFIMGLSVGLIYLVLASMFESVLIPFAVLFSIPLALLFGVAGLLIMGLSLDVMARLSLVILVGIAVNNAIILIDIILELKAQGLRRHEAVVQGCARRFKAVLMTTSIQVIGVLPVAMGKAKIMGIPYASLGVCIISGMLFSTVLTLVILPMVYEFLDDCELKLKRMTDSMRG